MDYQTEYIQKNPGMHLSDSHKKAEQILSLLSGNIKYNTIQYNTILDVACGAGQITIELCKGLSPKKNVGIDVSQVMINKAKTLDTNKLVHWETGNIFEYKSQEKFDLVTCIDILEHVEDDASFLKKMGRLGSRVVIKTPLEDSYFSRIIRKLGIFDTWADTESRYGHVHHYNERELIKLINDNGLEIEKSISVPMPKRSKMIWEFFRIFFYPISIISMDRMVKISGGFKILLLRSNG